METSEYLEGQVPGIYEHGIRDVLSFRKSTVGIYLQKHPRIDTNTTEHLKHVVRRHPDLSTGRKSMLQSSLSGVDPFLKKAATNFHGTLTL